jgi:dihydrofolate reductase
MTTQPPGHPADPLAASLGQASKTGAGLLGLGNGTPVGQLDAVHGDEPRLTAIAAVAQNGVIGDGRGLLWHLPEDFARFKRVTMGGVLLMGRRTFDSLGGPLPGRQSIVLSRATGLPLVWCPWPGPGPSELVMADTRPIRVEARRPVPPAEGIPAFGAGVYVAARPDLALRLSAWYPERPWWSSGGGEIYSLLWPYTTDLDLTEVHASPDGAVRFPVVDPVYWTETRREPGREFDFVGYKRRTLDARQRLLEVTASSLAPKERASGPDDA